MKDDNRNESQSSFGCHPLMMWVTPFWLSHLLDLATYCDTWSILRAIQKMQSAPHQGVLHPVVPDQLLSVLSLLWYCLHRIECDHMWLGFHASALHAIENNWKSYDPFQWNCFDDSTLILVGMHTASIRTTNFLGQFQKCFLISSSPGLE